MRLIASAMLAAALNGCAPAVTDTPLADLDLADGKTLVALQNALPADDRAALGTYALLHWPRSRFYCGEPIGGSARVAKTVGEAIAVTRAYEKRLADLQTRESATAGVQRQTAERTLINRMDQLALDRDALYSMKGPAAASSARAAQIERDLSALRAQLEDLRRTTI